MKQFTILTAILLSFATDAASTTRNSIGRYILLRDRSLTDNLFFNGPHQDYFKMRTNISSGLKDLIGDIKSGTDSSTSSSQKTTNVLSILNKNINTEKFIDIGLELNIPLPSFKYSRFTFLPSLFASGTLGGLVTVANKVDGTNPNADIYLNKEIRYGVASTLLWKNRFNESLQVALYKKSVSDLFISKDATSIATGGSLVETSELKDEDNSYSVDFSYKRENEKYALIIDLWDLKLMKASGSKESRIGNTPFLHTRYDFKNDSTGAFKFTPFLGAHYRKRHTIAESLYLGTNIAYQGHIPVSTIFKMDNQFLTFLPRIEFRHFHFSYGLRTPYRNPQDDIWVPTIHSIHIGIPF
ncbi:hypothetical protein M899_0686 [Bacteriovorax sp. BSW11_IV]|uniref:hypothetical protein n=1 Tax=Bacteriovorax sp. BSW11_IV TaxID=1353529 RepID=UPI00038A4632|nr:hypothetical protein [Bacteriovorax sp. BSW11_IV]EQC49188.1 hypothetical protein M899_0686 [Bacteriovorax sp. BSW11_IV]